MSFGPSATTKTAENNLGGVSNQATTASTAEQGLGTNLLNAGAPAVTSGTNFLNTLLNGNQANTSALLAPTVQQTQQNNQNAIQGLSTLTPRGGGRSGTLFGASYAPEGQLTNLFNNARTTAATTLPQIGLQQQGLGANLIGTSNQPLSTAASASGNLGSLGLQQQQLTNQLYAGLGAGLFGLATTPFGGGSSQNGLLGLI
jgi:hypothetical protein